MRRLWWIGILAISGCKSFGVYESGLQYPPDVYKDGNKTIADVKFNIDTIPTGADIYGLNSDGTQHLLGKAPIDIVVRKAGYAKFVIKELGYHDKELYVPTSRKKLYASEETKACFRSHFLGYMLTGGIWNQITDPSWGPSFVKTICVGTLLDNYKVKLEKDDDHGIHIMHEIEEPEHNSRI